MLAETGSHSVTMAGPQLALQKPARLCSQGLGSKVAPPHWTQIFLMKQAYLVHLKTTVSCVFENMYIWIYLIYISSFFENFMFKLIRTLKVKVKRTQNQRVHWIHMSTSVLPMKSSAWKCNTIIHVSICAISYQESTNISPKQTTLSDLSHL